MADKKELVVVDAEGNLQNRGEWDLCIVDDVIEGNPWTGEGPAPEDWDFKSFVRGMITNPRPEDYRDEYHVLFLDKHGSLHLDRDREAVEALEAREELRKELDVILEDMRFDEATPEQIARGKEIRLKLKEA